MLEFLRFIFSGLKKRNGCSFETKKETGALSNTQWLRLPKMRWIQKQKTPLWVRKGGEISIAGIGFSAALGDRVFSGCSLWKRKTRLDEIPGCWQTRRPGRISYLVSAAVLALFITMPRALATLSMPAFTKNTQQQTAFIIKVLGTVVKRKDAVPGQKLARKGCSKRCKLQSRIMHFYSFLE